MDAYKAQQEREMKMLTLQRRKLKLGELLRKERDQYQAELKGLSSQNYVRLEDMKERSETLRSAREEKRKQLADDKLYEHFRVNNPDLREVSEALKDIRCYLSLVHSAEAAYDVDFSESCDGLLQWCNVATEM